MTLVSVGAGAVGNRTYRMGWALPTISIAILC